VTAAVLSLTAALEGGATIMKRLSLSLVVVATFVVATGTTGAAPLTPNASIFFYRNVVGEAPEQAMTGTLDSQGIFRRRATFKTTRWTAAAASRDSLALYNKATGKLQLGTFRSGIFSPTGTRTLVTGYTHVVATCDTVLFFNGSTGRGFTATLIDGKLGPKTIYALDERMESFVTSCDSLYVEEAFESETDDSTLFWRGVLEHGKYSETRVYHTDTLYRMTASADTYLKLTHPFTGGGRWGTLVDGGWTFTDGATGFGDWDVLVGTGKAVLFYIRDGFMATGTLTGGNYAYVTSRDFGAGWQIIAGGK
jgi:hypothetical protein